MMDIHFTLGLRENEDVPDAKPGQGLEIYVDK